MPILLSQTGPVAHMRFNRPEALNAIDVALAERFEALTAEIAADRSIRVLILSGAGRAFMAGGDLSVFQSAPDLPDAADTLIGPMHRAVVALQTMPQITIAALHGAVAGAGLSLALLTDLAIAADTAKLNMAYARIQAVPDCGGSWALTRHLGQRKALEVALLSENITAYEARQLGLVNRVVPEADLDAETEALAQRLARQSPTSAQGIRSLIRQATHATLQSQLDAERVAFRAAAATPEFAQSIAGFFARRAKT